MDLIEFIRQDIRIPVAVRYNCLLTGQVRNEILTFVSLSANGMVTFERAFGVVGRTVLCRRDDILEIEKVIEHQPIQEANGVSEDVSASQEKTAQDLWTGIPTLEAPIPCFNPRCDGKVVAGSYWTPVCDTCGVVQPT